VEGDGDLVQFEEPYHPSPAWNMLTMVSFTMTLAENYDTPLLMFSMSFY